MLAAMATVTTGILSPNSYALSTDAVALKHAHPEPMDAYHHHHHHRHPFSHTSATYSESHHSSDSEQEVSYTAQSPGAVNASQPKRNKRKNFKPRCSQNLPSEDEVVLNLTEYHENNNVRRRKPLIGPRRVIQDPSYTPMDLSGSKPDSEASERLSHDSEPLSQGSEPKNDSDNSDSDEFNTEQYRTHSENEETEENEPSSRIPSSFSIRNLSKPHVTEPAQNLSPDQISEMRNYAMNTMRELLGIYGLTSEVAESISRQLPLAAFSTGKIFENLSLTPTSKPPTSLSEPPTPPATPLSPKNLPESARSTPFGHTSHFALKLPQAHTPLSLGHALGGHALGGNASSTLIGHDSKSGLGQSLPLNLNLKKEETLANGLGDSGDYSFGEEGFRRKGDDERMEEGRHTGIFAGNVAFPHFNKTDTDPSPPPMESPLSAMMQQSMSTSMHSRDSLSSSSMLINKTSQVDYSKYVKKFTSSVECGSTYCKDLNYREHFHCLDCNSRVFIKKEEMIRHFKWHKKRDESLQHGFMRYSPLDDCSDKFSNCTHNKKQTHYHCIQENCDKVYISTSDVQMHSNYHRKDSAIMQEGFQRYRATEECGASYCAFFGQRTTHFHCRRPGCKYTFKNKSDMEKHKSYHIKDEQLSRDGFKKFMKNEACPFDNCRFSKVCNHIHCIRPQCSYVLHSSGQLFSHKRKHERKDSELAYRKYKLAQSMMKTLAEGGLPPSASQMNPFNPISRDYETQIDFANFYNQQNSMSNTESLSDRNSPLSYNDESEGALAMDLSASETSNFPSQDDTFNAEDFWRKYCQFVPEGQQCNFKDGCDYSFQEHFHCLQDNCEVTLSNKDGAKEHSRNHEQQDVITDNFFSVSELNDPCEDQSCVYQNKEKHFHCNLDSCREVVLSSDKPFRRLEHYKMHQYSQKLSLTKDPLTATHLTTSIDGMFCRKRGRPPKNRVIEVWNDYNPSGAPQSLMDSPQAIFTSFKLPKPSTTPSGGKEIDHDDDDDRPSMFSTNRSPSFFLPTQSVPNMADYAGTLQCFDSYGENTKCPDTLCLYLGAAHFHCNRKRCLYSTDQVEYLISHAKDFHENVEILEGFEFYDRMVDCRQPSCASNKVNRHFHCTRPDCNYSFVQYSQMALHNQKHEFPSIRVKSEELLVEKSDDAKPNLDLSQTDANKVSVVRASGTFYPISTLPHVSVDQRSSPPNRVVLTDHHQQQQTLPSTFDPQSAPSTTLYGPEASCSRPFCKLKRKPHYHCNACNQAFSELDKLLPHVARHSNNAFVKSEREPESNNNGSAEDERGSPENLSGSSKVPSEKQQTSKEASTPEATPPYFSTPTFDAYNHFSQFPPNFATQIALMQQQNAFLPQSIYQQGLPTQIMFQHAQLMQSPLLGHQNHAFQSENLTSPLAAMAANLNKRAMSPHEMSPEAKKARIQNSMRILKDEPVPAGYLRFRFNEDCKYQHCGYREHQTHFHCQRQDCGYSFCDKTRFVQHTARHERLDTLMGGDFQQYRANVACGRQDCAYTANLGSTQNKASHFHCLKCEFVCTDTNKVVAHRRQHQKLDSIQAAGFEKFTPSQICRVQNCQHSGKQTHYHCLSCQYAVLGLAQMSAHKYRHMEG